MVCGGCATSNHEVVYGSVASICTAEKKRIVDAADTPPTEEQQADFESTRNLCERILNAIEEDAK